MSGISDYSNGVIGCSRFFSKASQASAKRSDGSHPASWAPGGADSPLRFIHASATFQTGCVFHDLTMLSSVLMNPSHEFFQSMAAGVLSLLGCRWLTTSSSQSSTIDVTLITQQCGTLFWIMK